MLGIKLNNLGRKRHFHNFDTAKTVGILFDATHQESYVSTRKLVASLRARNLKVTALGYVASREGIDYFDKEEGFSFFCIKDVGLFLQPTAPEVAVFHSQPFDMLVDLSMEYAFPLKLVVSLSPATFKTGFGDASQMHYDMVINTQGQKGIKFCIEQLNHYMGVLRAA